MDNWRLQQLTGMLKEDPNDEFLLFAIAQEYTKLEQLETAIDHYNQLKNMNPEYVGLYYHLAAAYAELELVKEAARTYEEGILIAQKLGDQHALSELMNAKMNFELEMGF